MVGMTHVLTFSGCIKGFELRVLEQQRLRDTERERVMHGWVCSGQQCLVLLFFLEVILQRLPDNRHL